MKKLLLVLALISAAACSDNYTERYGSASDGIDDCTGGTTAGVGGASGASGAGSSSGGAGAGGAAAGAGGGGTGGSSAGTGGSSSGAAGSAGSGGSGGSAPTCDLSAYTPGVWRATVTQPPLGALGDGAGFGITIDPNNPGTVFAGIYAGPAPGLYKTTNCGATWAEVGTFAGVIQVRINPANSQELYVGVGVGPASTNDFYYTSNGGSAWSARSSWSNAVGNYDDVYSISVDPTDFAHVLVTFHSPGTSGIGIVESFNKGVTWREILPIAAWAGETQGCSIAFLYDLATGQGNPQTWLFGTQSKGFWRTADSGATWTKVGNRVQSHGGNSIYYAPNGALFSGGDQYPQRSMDNGLTWTNLTTASYGYYMAVGGYGAGLFTSRWTAATVANPTMAAMNSDTLVDNGNSWATNGPQNAGAYEFTKVDVVNGIMYGGMWESGVWAMKLP